MAKGPGPLLLLGGLGALLLVTRKKGDEPLPPPPNGGGGKPGGDDEADTQEPPAPAGSTIGPGQAILHVGADYILPFRTGPQPELVIHKLTGTPGTQTAWSQAVYGPNEDYVWEKETAKDFILIQFRRTGEYDFALEDFGSYNVRVV